MDNNLSAVHSWTDIRHRRTRPHTLRTNGKAERFIQTALREWAYATVYQTSLERCDRWPVCVHRYNGYRPHSSLKGKAPISRLGLSGNNRADLHIYANTMERAFVAA